MTQPTDVPVTLLPGTVRTFLTAHASRDVDLAQAAFSPTAEVTDEGITYRGSAAVRTFLRTGGAEFDYTTRLSAPSGSTTRSGSRTTGSRATSPAAWPTWPTASSCRAGSSPAWTSP